MSEALTLLLQQAEAERDESAAALSQARTRAEAARAQHEQLVAYRGEYRQRWSGRFAQGGAIELVHCYQTFTERLEQAIAQQGQVAAQCEQQLERARARLQERELRVQSVRKLIERRRHEQRRAEERRDQKLTDEAAQRSGWNSQLPSRLAS